MAAVTAITADTCTCRTRPGKPLGHEAAVADNYLRALLVCLENKALGEARPRPLDHSFSGRALDRNALSDRPGLPQQWKEGRACGGAFSPVPYLQGFSESASVLEFATYDISYRHPSRDVLEITSIR